LDVPREQIFGVKADHQMMGKFSERSELCEVILDVTARMVKGNSAFSILHIDPTPEL
jgi:hypothetical protein